MSDSELAELRATIADYRLNGVPIADRLKPCAVCGEPFGPRSYFSGGRWFYNVTLWKKQPCCSRACARRK